MTDNRQRRGLAAEQVAIKFLAANDWLILKHNWQPEIGGQVDIIAKETGRRLKSLGRNRQPHYAFFEVKYQTYWLLEKAAVSKQQLRRLQLSIAYFKQLTQVSAVYLYLLLLIPQNLHNRSLVQQSATYAPYISYTAYADHYIICYLIPE